jgi:ABC-type sugar transport system substrate-binding protein
MPLHKTYIDGFINAGKNFGLNIQNIYETFENYDISYKLTEQAIDEINNLTGIYVTSYNSVGVCNCLVDLGIKDKIAVIGQDLYPSLVKLLKEGNLNATIFQDQYNQAFKTIDALVFYLTNDNYIGKVELITPILVMQSNLECYNEYF